MTDELKAGVSPPALPSFLHSDYLRLDSNIQKLFRRVFIWVWYRAIDERNYLRRGNVIPYYWAVDAARLRLDLTTSELSLLSYLHQATNKGANYIHSDMVYNSQILPDMLQVSKSDVLKRLRRKGFLCRAYRDPAAPYLSRSFASHPVFINLTSAGVNIIKQIDKEIYHILLNTSLNDLTGTNKKP